MNAFYDHHKDSIRFNYRCFDRILLNGLIQPFQQPERVVGFFDVYRHLYPVSRDILRGAAEQFQVWVKEQAGEWNAPIVDAPKGRRDEFVDPYFKGARPDQIVVILKAREPARIMTAIGDKKANRWHLQIADRWIVQYNFYVNDQRWGRMFVRVCPYLPFSARVCLNQHHWLANRMREEGVDFQQCSNAFRKCAAPQRLQELADSLTVEDLLNCGQKWLARFTPFFTERERKQAGCQHRLFFSQIEYCDNLIFHRRAALDKLGERLLDANRTIGQPNKITVIFGRKITKHYRGKLQTEIYPHVVAALGCTNEHYSLAALRYDLSKLRAKGLVEKLPRSRRCRLPAKGYSICLIFLKLFDRVYAPLTAGLLRPVSADAAFPPGKRSHLDRLYQRVSADLDQLVHAVGLNFSLPLNENKIPVEAPITA